MTQKVEKICKLSELSDNIDAIRRKIEEILPPHMSMITMIEIIKKKQQQFLKTSSSAAVKGCPASFSSSFRVKQNSYQVTKYYCSSDSSGSSFSTTVTPQNPIHQPLL